MPERKNIEKMEFEEAIGELEEIARTLEEGKASLKDSVQLYERGVSLKKRCESILDAVQMKISKITADKNGEISVQETEI